MPSRWGVSVTTKRAGKTPGDARGGQKIPQDRHLTADERFDQAVEFRDVRGHKPAVANEDEVVRRSNQPVRENPCALHTHKLYRNSSNVGFGIGRYGAVLI